MGSVFTQPRINCVSPTHFKPTLHLTIKLQFSWNYEHEIKSSLFISIANVLTSSKFLSKIQQAMCKENSPWTVELKKPATSIPDDLIVLDLPCTVKRNEVEPRERLSDFMKKAEERIAHTLEVSPSLLQVNNNNNNNSCLKFVNLLYTTFRHA